MMYTECGVVAYVIRVGELQLQIGDSGAHRGTPSLFLKIKIKV